jgi:hypothetical protein
VKAEWSLVFFPRDFLLTTYKGEKVGKKGRKKKKKKNSGRVLQGGVDWIGRRWAGLFFHYFIPPGMLAYLMYGTDYGAKKKKSKWPKLGIVLHFFRTSIIATSSYYY